MIRVLVADDQALVRAGIRMLIETQPDLQVVGEAADGLAAIGEATRSSPDVVLMDIRMPRLDGIEAARRCPRNCSSGSARPPTGTHSSRQH